MKMKTGLAAKNANRSKSKVVSKDKPGVKRSLHEMPGYIDSQYKKPNASKKKK